MSPHRRHQITALAPLVSMAIAVGGALVSVAGAVWVAPKVQAAAQAERDKSMDEFKTKVNEQIGDLERARREDHELLIRIANDMGWVRKAMEKNKP